MLFIPSVNVDQIWRLIARAAIAGDLGISAKVAPHDLEGDPQGRRPRLICIYTKDFSNVEDVARVLSELKRLEMVASRGRIYYKLGKLMRVCLCYVVATMGSPFRVLT